MHTCTSFLLLALALIHLYLLIMGMHAYIYMYIYVYMYMYLRVHVSLHVPHLNLHLQSSDKFLAHARHMDRRWERMLHQQQAQNQELQKNMVVLASQMKGLEEEAIKKLRIKEPYSMLPPPLQASRTLSTSSSTAGAMVPVGSSELGAGSGTGVKVASKEEGGEEGGGEREGGREKGGVADGGATADVSGIGAVKPNTDVNYGEFTEYALIHPSPRLKIFIPLNNQIHDMLLSINSL